MAVNRVRADIDLDAVLYNMESMHKKLKPGTKIAAVVKADAYGHGAVEISRVLETFHISGDMQLPQAMRQCSLWKPEEKNL